MRVAGHGNSAGFQHIRAIRHGKRHAGVLFYQQNRGARRVQFLHDIENLLYQNRRKTHRRFVQHHQLGLAHQRAPHRQHLLFAAGQRARHLLIALLQARKALVHILNGSFDFARGAGIAAHFEVFFDGHLQKHAPAFRTECHAVRNDLVGRNAHDALAFKFDRAGSGLQKSGNGIQRGGFARTVRTDQRNDFAFVYIKGNALDGVNAAVVDMDILNMQQTHPYASLCLPR